MIKAKELRAKTRKKIDVIMDNIEEELLKNAHVGNGAMIYKGINQDQLPEVIAQLEGAGYTVEHLPKKQAIRIKW